MAVVAFLGMVLVRTSLDRTAIELARIEGSLAGGAVAQSTAASPDRPARVPGPDRPRSPRNWAWSIPSTANSSSSRVWSAKTMSDPALGRDESVRRSSRRPGEQSRPMIGHRAGADTFGPNAALGPRLQPPASCGRPPGRPEIERRLTFGLPCWGSGSTLAWLGMGFRLYQVQVVQASNSGRGGSRSAADRTDRCCPSGGTSSIATATRWR